MLQEVIRKSFGRLLKKVIRGRGPGVIDPCPLPRTPSPNPINGICLRQPGKFSNLHPTKLRGRWFFNSLLGPAQRWETVKCSRTRFQVSTRRASRILPGPGSTLCYRSRKPEQAPLRRRLREIAAVRVRYGYRRIPTLLQREGWRVNHQRVYRPLETYSNTHSTLRTGSKILTPGPCKLSVP